MRATYRPRKEDFGKSIYCVITHPDLSEEDEKYNGLSSGERARERESERERKREIKREIERDN